MQEKLPKRLQESTLKVAILMTEAFAIDWIPNLMFLLLPVRSEARGVIWYPNV